jgi:hypothetical protein
MPNKSSALSLTALNSIKAPFPAISAARNRLREGLGNTYRAPRPATRRMRSPSRATQLWMAHQSSLVDLVHLPADRSDVRRETTTASDEANQACAWIVVEAAKRTDGLPV